MEQGPPKVNQHSRLAEWASRWRQPEQWAAGMQMVQRTRYPSIHVQSYERANTGDKKHRDDYDPRAEYEELRSQTND